MLRSAMSSLRLVRHPAMRMSMRTLSNLITSRPRVGGGDFAPALRLQLRPFSEEPAGGYEASVAERLSAALDARSCEVTDRSGGCGASFNIAIESEKFRGQSKLKCQRMVQDVIRDEIAKWHAVTIQTKVPES
mmetsp:Transcript_98675/g.175691  ORF Transcript_98675/g.175691 Transcript_98675/m.175691 type:complete len:133 (-) Transcript_98675:8-406(-)